MRMLTVLTNLKTYSSYQLKTKQKKNLHKPFKKYGKGFINYWCRKSKHAFKTCTEIHTHTDL